MTHPVETQIRAIVNRETRAWDTQDVDLLLSIFHPDFVWVWPADAEAHDPAQWKLMALCSKPATCDQEVPSDLGAVDTPPFPWQNRGTFHQVVELAGHR